MKRLLLISYAFPPLAESAVHRVVKYAKYLPRLGWDVTVLTVRPENYYSYWLDDELGRQVPSEVKVARIPAPIRGAWLNRIYRGGTATGGGGASPSWLRVALRTLRDRFLVPDEKVIWVPAAVRWAKRQKPWDAMVTISLPSSVHLVGLRLKKALGIPWVAEFQDPWVANPYRPRFDSEREVFLEGEVVHHAERVVASTGAMETDFRQRYAREPGTKFLTITNGYDPDDFPAAEVVASRKLVLVHLGAFYGPRSPRPLMEGLGCFLDRNPERKDKLELLLVGENDPESNRVIREAKNLRDVVQYRGFVPYRESLRLMQQADVLVLVTDAGGGGENLIPGKLFEYIGAGKPILALCPPAGESAKLVGKTASGLVVAPTDIEGIADAIAEMARRYEQGTLGELNRQRNVEGIQRQALAQGLSGVLNELVNEVEF